jgi:hypothetical protein
MSKLGGHYEKLRRNPRYANLRLFVKQRQLAGG